MGKDNKILIIGVGVLAGYLLMPEKVRERLPGGGGGGLTSLNLSDLLGGINIPGGIPGGETIINYITEATGKAEDAVNTVTETVDKGKDIVDLVTDPVKAITDPVKEIIDGVIKGIEDVIPEDMNLFNQPVGEKKSGTERNIGGKWNDFVAGWQDKQTYPTFFGKTLLDHLTSWFAPTGYAEVSPYAESVLKGAKTESPGDSEINRPSYLAERGNRESTPTRETPGGKRWNRPDPGRYTAYKGGREVKMDLSSAMRYGGGT